jgi:L-threonylcarbamoyladenylate synthase
MMQQARIETAAGRRVGILTVDEYMTHFESLEGVFFSLGSKEDVEQIAHHLFAGLRTLDEQGVDVILAHSPAENGIGLAIYDRLLRAAEGHVVETDH